MREMIVMGEGGGARGETVAPLGRRVSSVRRPEEPRREEGGKRTERGEEEGTLL